MSVSVFDVTPIAGRFTSAAWHPTMPILLAAKEHGRIVSYTEEGEELAAEEQAFDLRDTFDTENQDDITNESTNKRESSDVQKKNLKKLKKKPLHVAWSPKIKFYQSFQSDLNTNHNNKGNSLNSTKEGQTISSKKTTIIQEEEAAQFGVVAWSNGTIGIHIAATGRYLVLPLNNDHSPIHLLAFHEDEQIDFASEEVIATETMFETPKCHLWTADENGRVSLIDLLPLSNVNTEQPKILKTWTLHEDIGKIKKLIPIGPNRCLLLTFDNSILQLRFNKHNKDNKDDDEDDGEIDHLLIPNLMVAKHLSPTIINLFRLSKKERDIAMYMTDHFTLHPFRIDDKNHLHLLPTISLPIAAASSISRTLTMPTQSHSVPSSNRINLPTHFGEAVLIEDYVLLICTGSSIRGVDMRGEDDHLLFSLPSLPDTTDQIGVFTAIHFHPFSKTLAVATENGFVLQWRMRKQLNKISNDEKIDDHPNTLKKLKSLPAWRSWDKLSTISTGGQIDAIVYRNE